METKQIDISIIIPLYKGARFCNRLLKVIRQNCLYQGFYKSHVIEVVFVNDYPKERIIIEKQEKEFVTRLIFHEKNQGIHAARVTGIKNSRGKFIIMLDQDVLEYSLGYSDKGYLDMCRYCNGAEAKDKPIPVAEQGYGP